MGMIYINPLDLVEYFKFGYDGPTIDLIYLLLVGVILFKLSVWFIKLIGGVLND